MITRIIYVGLILFVNVKTYPIPIGGGSIPHSLVDNSGNTGWLPNFNFESEPQTSSNKQTPSQGAWNPETLRNIFKNLKLPSTDQQNAPHDNNNGFEELPNYIESEEAPTTGHNNQNNDDEEPDEIGDDDDGDDEDDGLGDLPNYVESNEIDEGDADHRPSNHEEGEDENNDLDELPNYVDENENEPSHEEKLPENSKDAPQHDEPGKSKIDNLMDKVTHLPDMQNFLPSSWPNVFGKNPPNTRVDEPSDKGTDKPQENGNSTINRMMDKVSHLPDGMKNLLSKPSNSDQPSNSDKNPDNSLTNKMMDKVNQLPNMKNLIPDNAVDKVKQIPANLKDLWQKLPGKSKSQATDSEESNKHHTADDPEDEELDDDNNNLEDSKEQHGPEKHSPKTEEENADEDDKENTSKPTHHSLPNIGDLFKIKGHASPSQNQDEEQDEGDLTDDFNPDDDQDFGDFDWENYDPNAPQDEEPQENDQENHDPNDQDEQLDDDPTEDDNQEDNENTHSTPSSPSGHGKQPFQNDKPKGDDEEEDFDNDDDLDQIAQELANKDKKPNKAEDVEAEDETDGDTDEYEGEDPVKALFDKPFQPASLMDLMSTAVTNLLPDIPTFFTELPNKITFTMVSLNDLKNDPNVIRKTLRKKIDQKTGQKSKNYDEERPQLPGITITPWPFF